MASIWFEGPINEAVQLVNTKNCLFIVFLHDSSDNSDTLNQIISDTSLHDTLKDNVIIKLSHESDNAKLFGQLYPIHRVPMIYFIKQGIIKDFAIETTSAQEIKDKITKLSSITESTSGSSTPNDNINTTVSNTPASSSSFNANNNNNNIPINTTNKENDNKEAKEKLKKQMELARQKREEKEKQQAKEREMKRRQDGKESQVTRQQMEEKQNKLYFEKIKKEKQADEEHRRKIKEQIARDRAEKQSLLKQKKLQQSNNNDNDTPSPSREYNECHLNIRQTDGQNLRNKFNANDTLGDVRKWIDENRTDGEQPYKLLAQFPTKHFSVGDEDKTLQQLNLLPSATIIMKWIKNVSNAYQSNGQNNSGMMDYVYSAGGLLYNTVSGVGSTLTGFVGGFFNGIPPPSSSSSDQPYSSSSSPSLFSNNPPVHGQRLGGGSNPNNHRFNTLRQSEFDDDENDRNKRTYNGNSINQE